MMLELKDAFQAGKNADIAKDSPKEKNAEKKPDIIEREKIVPDIAVRVRMLNINYGRNKELLDACKPLGEYAWLIQQIRTYGKKMKIEEAVDQAINELPEDFEIRTFLVGHRAEVKSMCITEYNEAETMQLFKEQWEQERTREIAERMIRANEPGDKIVLYTGLEKNDVDKLAGKMNTVLVWNMPGV